MGNFFLCVKQLTSTIISRIRFFNQRIAFDSSSFISHRAILKITASDKVSAAGSISIGKNCYIAAYSMILTYRGKIEIGDDCSINPFTILYGHGGLKIGNGVRIATHCVIIPSNHNFDRTDIPIFDQGEENKGIKINDDVWIGANSTILDGVEIGTGCVIGAGSVVTRSIPDFSIAVGVPAKVIRKRHEPPSKVS